MRPKKVNAMRHAVYLLHITTPDANPSHYVGITTPTRIKNRLREHAAGRGSKATRAACELGSTFHLSRVWRTPWPSLERRIRDHPGLESLCPCCAGRMPLWSCKATKKGTIYEWSPLEKALRVSLGASCDPRDQDREKRPVPQDATLFPNTGDL